MLFQPPDSKRKHNNDESLNFICAINVMRLKQFYYHSICLFDWKWMKIINEMPFRYTNTCVFNDSHYMPAIVKCMYSNFILLYFILFTTVLCCLLSGRASFGDIWRLSIDLLLWSHAMWSVPFLFVFFCHIFPRSTFNVGFCAFLPLHFVYQQS